MLYEIRATRPCGKHRRASLKLLPVRRKIRRSPKSNHLLRENGFAVYGGNFPFFRAVRKKFRQFKFLNKYDYSNFQNVLLRRFWKRAVIRNFLRERDSRKQRRKSQLFLLISRDYAHARAFFHRLSGSPFPRPIFWKGRAFILTTIQRRCTKNKNSARKIYT